MNASEVEKILWRIKRRIERDRRLPVSLLKHDAYAIGTPGRERAFGEANVLAMAIGHVAKEIRLVREMKRR